MADQLTPYWDAVNKQFLGPANVPGASVENLVGIQTTGATATIPLGIATRAGVIKDVRVAAIVPLGAPDTFTVDVKQNGTTILSGGPLALLSSTTARTSVVGTLATVNAPVAAGDFFEAVITYTHTSGTAPTGVVAQVQLLQN